VTGEGCITATLADVPVGATVQVRGRVDGADPASLVEVALDVKARAADPPSQRAPDKWGRQSRRPRSAAFRTNHGRRPAARKRLDRPALATRSASSTLSLRLPIARPFG